MKKPVCCESPVRCEAIEPRRLLAAIAPGVAVTGSGDKTFTLPLTVGTDVLIATHISGKVGNINVSLVNPSVGSSVGFAVIAAAGHGRTGNFRVSRAGTFEVRIDVASTSKITGKWTTTLFTRTAAQRSDDSTATSHVTGKTYAGRVSGASDADWYTIAQPQDGFTGASFGATDGASAKNFDLVHVTPDGIVEHGGPGSNESWWTDQRPDDFVAGAQQYYLVSGKTGNYAMSFSSLPDARDPDVDDHATLKSGKTYNGRITSGDQDVFPIQVQRGATFSATLKAAKGSSLDPGLRLVRADGVELSADDDKATARVSTGAAKDNTVYYLIARGASMTNGTYSLSYKLSRGTGVGTIDDRGVLHIEGTRKHDRIHVTTSMSAGDTAVEINGATTVYARGAVRTLDVDAGDGNDLVDFSATSLPGRVYGGGGDDTIAGGSGDDKLYGEAGNDTLAGNAGRDLLDGGKDKDTVLSKEPTDVLKSVEHV